MDPSHDDMALIRWSLENVKCLSLTIYCVTGLIWYIPICLMPYGVVRFVCCSPGLLVEPGLQNIRTDYPNGL